MNSPKVSDVKEVIADGTEHQSSVQNRERQKEYYLGKGASMVQRVDYSHTRKRVIIRTKTRAGKVHDKWLLHESEIVQYIPDEEHRGQIWVSHAGAIANVH
ncbi:hypothetical protein U9R62_06850 [Cylindrospermopsis raciborskii DSH]